MRAVIYASTGDASVLQVVERPLEEPAEGEVRIRVVVSGVNPTDWKSRSGAFGRATGRADGPQPRRRRDRRRRGRQTSPAPRPATASG